jgi:hypothetical protein
VSQAALQHLPSDTSGVEELSPTIDPTSLLVVRPRPCLAMNAGALRVRAVAAVSYASGGRSRPREFGRQLADPLSSNGLCQEIVEPCEHAHDPFGG